MAIITSLQNPKIKHLIKLREPRVRQKEKFVIVEGVRECACALASKVNILEIFVCRERLDAEGAKIVKALQGSSSEIFDVNIKVFEKLAFGNRNEGLVAVGKEPTLALDSISLENVPLIIVTDSVEKPGNLGAIIRTANAAGCNAVITANKNVDIYNQNVIRASLGSVFNTPTCAATQEETLKWLHKNKIEIVTAHPEAQSSYLSLDYTKPTAFILGREDTGVSEWWHEHTTHHISIPMRGAVNSLNVSVTAAILIYEALRQRQK
jgi:TrmH family RNA methyltransferase